MNNGIPYMTKEKKKKSNKTIRNYMKAKERKRNESRIKTSHWAEVIFGDYPDETI
jgi:hypothetical protein